MMRALEIVALYFALAFPLAVLVGRFIEFGSGETDDC
jgi:hypothetical protein